MNTLQNFYFKQNEIRLVMIEDDPWFVAADVCQVLGMTASGQVKYLIDQLDKDETCLVRKSNLSLTEISFPNRGANCVSESGLYKLVMRSDKPQARPFQNWVTREVLPSIRKNGGYIAGQENMSEMEILANATLVAQRVIEDQRKKLARMALCRRNSKMSAKVSLKSSTYAHKNFGSWALNGR